MKNEDIEKLMACSDSLWWLTQDTSEYFGEAIGDFGEFINGKDVIELGPGITFVPHYAFKGGATSYVGVEPFAPETTKKQIELLSLPPEYKEKIRLVGEDALTFLSTRPDDSAIVLSRSVLREDIIGGGRSNFYDLGKREIKNLANKYRIELCREIYRVTPPNLITMHIAIDDSFQDEFLKAGFKKYGNYDEVFIKQVES